MLLHNTQKLDNDFRARSDQDLSLPSLLSVIDGVERIVQDTCFDHPVGCWCEILKSMGNEVSIAVASNPCQCLEP